MRSVVLLAATVTIALTAPTSGCNQSRPHKAAQKNTTAPMQAPQPRPMLERTPSRRRGAAPTDTARPRPKTVHRWPLDKTPIGKLPASLIASKGRWLVSTDRSTGKAIQTIEQSAKNANPVYNVLLVKDLKMADVHLRVKLLAISGKLDQGGGLLWRALDARNYYITRYNPLENNLRLYTVKNGRRKQLASASVTLPSRTWFTLYATMKGDHIQVRLGGKQLLDVHDKTFPKAGRIGLWTKADARTHFSGLWATTPD